MTVADPRAAVASVGFWYHVLEPAPGVLTPGWFDLRPIVERLPWPDVRGKRCLDVGTYDGFLAFELERRGAAEVVATDISDHAEWDHEVRLGPQSAELLETIAGDKGAGFDIARALLGSSVEKVEVNAYDLAPEHVGQFDVVVCGSLLLHLRDPVAALEAIRSVCREAFLSAEQIRLDLSVRHPRRPVAELHGSDLCQWWIPTIAGHRRLLFAAGFALERVARPYCIPLRRGHPAAERTPASVAASLLNRLLTGGDGVPHTAALAKPRL